MHLFAGAISCDFATPVHRTLTRRVVLVFSLSLGILRNLNYILSEIRISYILKGSRRVELYGARQAVGVIFSDSPAIFSASGSSRSGGRRCRRRSGRTGGGSRAGRGRRRRRRRRCREAAALAARSAGGIAAASFQMKVLQQRTVVEHVGEEREEARLGVLLGGKNGSS